MQDPYEQVREQMVREQIERRGITDARVLDAMRSVPRHRFVPPDLCPYAYEDGPLPIGWDQTISQPYIVALMTELLRLQGTETVLEVGTGSGYQCAVLSRLAQSVHSIEIFPALAAQSAALLADLGCANVSVHCANGALGWLPAAPYPAIIVTAAPLRVPDALLQQLAPGGVLVLPVGARWAQELQVWHNAPTGMQVRSVLGVSFVPLRAELE